MILDLDKSGMENKESEGPSSSKEQQNAGEDVSSFISLLPFIPMVLWSILPLIPSFVLYDMAKESDRMGKLYGRGANKRIHENADNDGSGESPSKEADQTTEYRKQMMKKLEELRDFAENNIRVLQATGTTTEYNYLTDTFVPRRSISMKKDAFIVGEEEMEDDEEEGLSHKKKVILKKHIFKLKRKLDQSSSTSSSPAKKSATSATDILEEVMKEAGIAPKDA